MPDIALTTAQIGIIFPDRAEITDMIANETITAGQAVYQMATGRAALADASAAGTAQFRGIALTGGGAGQAISVLVRGHVYGFTVAGLAADALAYLSETAGALADAAPAGPAITVNCGRVTTLTDSAATKVLYVVADWLRSWT